MAENSKESPVEAAFPKEEKQHGSFKKLPEEDIPKPQLIEIALYCAQKLRNIENLLTQLVNANKPVGVPTEKGSTPPPQSVKVDPNDKLVKLTEALQVYIEDGSVAIDDKESATFYVVKILRFLGTEKFAIIGAIIRDFNGEYVSQGKNSHFNVPKK